MANLRNIKEEDKLEQSHEKKNVVEKDEVGRPNTRNGMGKGRDGDHSGDEFLGFCRQL